MQQINSYRVIRFSRNNNINSQDNAFFINNINNIMSQFNNMGINQNNVNNSNYMSNNEDNNNIYDQDFDRKKQKLILEMDEFQYKHIIKYNSRKDTKCSICLNEFSRTDIIKSFYKCEHIFHKVAYLNG